MNRSDARAVHDGNGWKGEFRLSWKADYESVMLTDFNGRKTDRIQYFKSSHWAELAAWRLKNTLEQSVMTRDGVRIGDLSKPMQRSRAETHGQERAEG